MRRRTTSAVTRARATLCALAWLAVAAGCSPPHGREAQPGVTLRFWAMGAEGELVRPLLDAFERENPGVRVESQQIPWSAAHEKLLTSIVGRSTPDVSQLGNTWIAEFSALNALAPLSPWMVSPPRVDSTDFFAGIWDTNVVDGVTYGVPWYVDTRVIFYRTDILRAAGYDAIPQDWDGWLACMRAIKRNAGAKKYAIFLPVNEAPPLIALGLSAGSDFLTDNGTRAAFRSPEFRRAFAFYLRIFEDGLAPRLGNAEMSNVYQEIERGTFDMFITGPWNLGEFSKRLPPELQSAWSTAPLPGPTGRASGLSTAGGASLVMFRYTRHPREAWKLIEFLSRHEHQVQFYRASGDLPARVDAWNDTTFTRDARIRAFGEQLRTVRSTPKVPEWEQIDTQMWTHAETAVRGVVPPESALANLDRAVDRILEKRRWIVSRRVAL